MGSSSVITAVHDSEATVAQAIDSVACQTHPLVEHLIVERLSRDVYLAAILGDGPVRFLSAT